MRWSEQSCYNSCPYRYKLEHIERIQKFEYAKESNDMIWGQAIHKALEAHYKGHKLEDIKKEFLKVYPNDLNDIKKDKTVESGLKLLEEYVVQYKEKDLDWNILETELEGSYENDEGVHTLHIDLVAEHKPSSSIYFWDHKTTGKNLNYMYWKKFDIDSQLTRYTYFVKKKYRSCAGAIINAIAVGYRSKKYKNEPAGLWFKFERQLFNRTDLQIDYWLHSDKEWCDQIASAEKYNLWPKALSAICNYCQYHELCISGGDLEIKNSLYEKKEG